MSNGLLSVVRVVARKELVEIFRDKRSLLVLLLLPVALYPMLMIGFAFLSTTQMRKIAEQEHVVWVEGLDALPEILRANLRLVEDGGSSKLRLRLTEAPPNTDYSEALADKRVVAIVRGVPREVSPVGEADPPTIEVLFNGGLDTSVLVQRDISRALRDWSETLVEERLVRANLSGQILVPFVAKPVDQGPPGAALAKMLAMVLVVLALTGAFYPALDLGAGEKERGTLETLLLAPVPRLALALGKFVAVFVVTFLCAVLHILSMGVTVGSFALVAPDALTIAPDPMVLPAILVILLPLVALFSALALALATFAASYKEGQSYLTPVMLLGTVPAMAAILPGMELTPTLCLVPVLGATLLTKALLTDTYTLGQIVLVTGSTFAYAGLAVRWVASLYEQEEVLWRPAAASGPDLLGLRGDAFGRERVPSLPQAAAMGVFGLLLLWFVGVPVQKWYMPLGLAITLIGLVAVPSVTYARLLGCDLRATFRLVRPSPLSFAVALLFALGCVGIVLDVMQVQQAWTGSVTDAERRAGEELASQLEALGPGVVLLLLSVLPGICEELLFRGFVLSGLRRDGGVAGPVLVTALLFAVFHLDPGRILPTFMIGVLLGVVVVRSGSILPAMLMHMTYNAASYLAFSVFQEDLADLGFLTGADQDEATWLLRGLGLGVLALGGVLLLIVRPAKLPADEASPELPSPSPGSGRVVVALPTKDFEVTEVVVPWNVLRRAGVEVVFATADGQPGACDPLLLTGVIFGQLGALPENVALYAELIETEAFKAPIRYADMDPSAFHGLLLPGGHAPGMKQYLESEELQDTARAFLAAGVPVGAICHGVLVLARAKDPATGHSVLRGRRVTALTGLLERLAYALTFWKLGRYYRTYPATVQEEIAAALGGEGSFAVGPLFASYEDPFHVTDGNLVTARWPGDAQGFASAFLAKVCVRASGSAPTGGEDSAQL